MTLVRIPQAMNLPREGEECSLVITRAFLGHRTIADDVFAEHVVDVLHVTPILRISILKP